MREKGSRTRVIRLFELAVHQADEWKINFFCASTSLTEFCSVASSRRVCYDRREESFMLCETEYKVIEEKLAELFTWYSKGTWSSSSEYGLTVLGRY